ncbi:hypothetical protein OQA88_3656 [Cercophora sp. LCS_1]
MDGNTVTVTLTDIHGFSLEETRLLLVNIDKAAATAGITATFKYEHQQNCIKATCPQVYRNAIFDMLTNAAAKIRELHHIGDGLANLAIRMKSAACQTVNFDHYATWALPNGGNNKSIDAALQKTDLNSLEKELDVQILVNPSNKKEFQLSATNDEALKETQARLDTLAAYHASNTQQHILYIDNYKEVVKPQVLADCRVVRHITSNLAEATIMDPARVSSDEILQSRYKALRDGDIIFSIRLREYNNVTGNHEPLCGPEVVRPNMDTWKVDRLRLRPEVSYKDQADVVAPPKNNTPGSPPGVLNTILSIQDNRQSIPAAVGNWLTDSTANGTDMTASQTTEATTSAVLPGPESDVGSIWAGSDAGFSIDSDTPLAVGERETIQVDNDCPAFGDLDTAIGAMAVHGPYLRGKLSLRAEFGRILLVHVPKEYASLAKETYQSDMVRMLNKHYGNSEAPSHFTKVLTNHGPDMLNGMLRCKTQNREIWNERPLEGKTDIVYWFFCKGSDGTEFVVKIKDLGAENAFWYSLHRVSGAGIDFYNAVHDLQIVLTQHEPQALEEKFGDFARDLLKSLRILDKEANRLFFDLVAKFGVTIGNVRANTTWRYASTDSRATLEVTEVEQLKLRTAKDYGGGRVKAAAVDWQAGDVGAPGELRWWYEAAVVAPAVEDWFVGNQDLGLGQKAAWPVEDLGKSGVLLDLHGPALATLAGLDNLGRAMDNRLPGLP